MQRYDHKLNYIGTGEYVSDMEPSDSGEFYLASDVDALIAEMAKALREVREHVRDLECYECVARIAKLEKALRDMAALANPSE